MKRIYLPDGAHYTASPAQKKELNSAISKLRWAYGPNPLTGFSQGFALNVMVRDCGYQTDRIGESGPGSFFNNHCLLAIRNNYNKGPIRRSTLYALFLGYQIVKIALDEETKDEWVRICQRNHSILKKNKNLNQIMKKSGKQVAFKRSVALLSQTIMLQATTQERRAKPKPFQEEVEHICTCCDEWYKEWKNQGPFDNLCQRCTRRYELRKKVSDYQKAIALLTSVLKTEYRRRLLDLPAYKQRLVVDQARKTGVINYCFR